MYKDKTYGALLDATASCGQVVKIGTDAAHVTPVAAITDIPYGVILGGDAGELDDVTLAAGDFVDVAFDGVVPCIVGTEGVTKGGWVCADASGHVIDVPDSALAETVVIALGIAMATATDGNAVDVAISRCAFTVPAAS